VNIVEIRSAVGSYSTAKVLAEAGARVKGTPQLLNGKVVFPFDDYADGADKLYVFKAERAEVTAQAANSQIASENFSRFDKIYWDNGAGKFTKTAGANTLCGRALESKDLSGGVGVGATLLIEFSPDVV
jgi:hypothetical protein